MNEDSESKVKWLIALAVAAVTAALAFVVMRNMGKWLVSGDL